MRKCEWLLVLLDSFVCQRCRGGRGTCHCSRKSDVRTHLCSPVSAKLKMISLISLYTRPPQTPSPSQLTPTLPSPLPHHRLQVNSNVRRMTARQAPQSARSVKWLCVGVFFLRVSARV